MQLGDGIRYDDARYFVPFTLISTQDQIDIVEYNFCLLWSDSIV